MTQEEFHKRYEYKPATDCLGEGGFGKVFKAYDTHLDKWVAIKMAEVKPGLEQIRLKHEVDLVNKLPTHPNIARYEECFTFSSFTGEYDFAVLQYYEFGNLQQLLETTQLTEQQKDSILRQILAGIHFLHNQGIIHRDLKPQNILIVNRRGEYIPKITDFGISKKLDINKSSVFTNSLSGVGTLAYASPEQLRGQTIKKNTDLWSFAVIVCWIFTGRLPFTSGSQAVTNEAGRIELFRQITFGDVSEIIKELPSLWSGLVKQCIVVDNEKRINNATNCLNLLIGKIKAFENKTILIEENTASDIDGNLYHTIKIGNQIWMVENLKTTRYNDGRAIKINISREGWNKFKNPSFCWYNNNKQNNINNGALYNWHAVNTNLLAPKGWRVPTNADWKELEDFLIRNKYNFDDSHSNRIAKALASQLSWNISSNVGDVGYLPSLNNLSGFTAFASGYRDEFGSFNSIGTVGIWWSASDGNLADAWCKSLHNNSSFLNSCFDSKNNYFSVRCIKD